MHISINHKLAFSFCPLVSSRNIITSVSKAQQFTTLVQKKSSQQSNYVSPPYRRCIYMIEQNTVIALLTVLLGTGGGIALVAWTENQGKRTEQRQNLQPCTECKGDTIVICNVCNGDTKDPIDKSQTCSYCEGKGKIKCFNCAGSGIQPRYLDRLSPEDFMD